MTESLPAVGRTAVGVAGLRARESRRPDRLFDDPHAAAFFTAGRSALPENRPSRRLVALLVYLSRDEADRMLTTVTGLSAPGSTVSFEHRADGTPDSLLARAKAAPGSEHITGLWKGGLGDRAPEWLREHGWEPATVTGAQL